MPKKKKHKKKSSLTKRLVTLALAIVIVFAVLFAAAKTFGKVPLSKATDAFTSLTSEMGEFPYEVQSNSVRNVISFGSGIAVLKTDTVDILSKSGKLLQSVRHNYAEPALDVCDSRAVLFERGGTRYTVLSKTGVLLEETHASSKILDACMSPDGKVAIAVAANDVKSVLSVYDTSFEELFRWKCVSEYITDIDFSDNGKRAAVSVAGVRNAKPYSRLVTFDFKKSEPMSQTDFDGIMLFGVNMKRSYVTVVSDTYMCSVKNGTEKLNEIQFGGDILKNFCFEENGRSAAILLSYGNERAAKLYTSDKKGAPDYEISMTEKTFGVSRSRAYTCVLTESRVLTYNNSGTLVNELLLEENVRDICVSGRSLYVLYSDRIEKYSAS